MSGALHICFFARHKAGMPRFTRDLGKWGFARPEPRRDGYYLCRVIADRERSINLSLGKAIDELSPQEALQVASALPSEFKAETDWSALKGFIVFKPTNKRWAYPLSAILKWQAERGGYYDDLLELARLLESGHKLPLGFMFNGKLMLAHAGISSPVVLDAQRHFLRNAARNLSSNMLTVSPFLNGKGWDGLSFASDEAKQEFIRLKKKAETLLAYIQKQGRVKLLLRSLTEQGANPTEWFASLLGNPPALSPSDLPPLPPKKERPKIRYFMRSFGDDDTPFLSGHVYVVSKADAERLIHNNEIINTLTGLDVGLYATHIEEAAEEGDEALYRVTLAVEKKKRELYLPVEFVEVEPETISNPVEIGGGTGWYIKK